MLINKMMFLGVEYGRGLMIDFMFIAIKLGLYNFLYSQWHFGLGHLLFL